MLGPGTRVYICIVSPVSIFLSSSSCSSMKQQQEHKDPRKFRSTVKSLRFFKALFVWLFILLLFFILPESAIFSLVGVSATFQLWMHCCFLPPLLAHDKCVTRRTSDRRDLARALEEGWQLYAVQLVPQSAHFALFLHFDIFSTLGDLAKTLYSHFQA